MSSVASELEVFRCLTCHHRFAPADGVCPRCASTQIEPFRIPAIGTVLAATEVSYPAEGWPTPHRLALVELAEAVRLLAVAGPSLPTPGEVVELEAGPGYYRARTEPSPKG